MDAQATQYEEPDLDAPRNTTLHAPVSHAEGEWEMVDGTSPSMPRPHTLDSLSGLMKGSAPAHPIPKSTSLGKNLKAFASAIKRVGSSRSDLANINDFRAPTLPSHLGQGQETQGKQRMGSVRSDTVSLMQVDELRPITPTLPAPHRADPAPEEHSPAPTTIRLVKSSAPPLEESPELPGGGRSVMFSDLFPLLSQGLDLESRGSPSVYPKLPELPPAASAVEQETPLPGAFPFPAAPSTPAPTLPAPAPDSPFQFIFGSPERGVTKAEFSKVTRSVLDELNKRVVANGGKPWNGGPPVLSFTGDKQEKQEEVGPLGRSRGRFDAVHDKQFSKMDSVVTHYAARRGTSTEAVTSFQTRANKRKSTESGVSALSSGEEEKEEVMERFGRSRDRFEALHNKQFAKMDSIVTHYAARRSRSTEAGADFQARATKRKSTESGVSALSSGEEENAEKVRLGRSRDRFEALHNKQFSKMDSIVNHYSARRPSSVETFQARANKRKSTDGHPPPRAGPSIAQDEADEGDRRASKRPRVSSAPTKKIQPSNPGKGEVVQVRDTPAKRRKLDTAARARRSSLARRSPPGARATGTRLTSANNGTGVTKSASGEKIGFFGRTAKAVRNVFAAGPTATKPMPVPPVPRSMNRMPVQGAAESAAGKPKEKEEKEKGKPAISNPSALQTRAPTQKAAAYGALSAAPRKPSVTRTASNARVPSDSRTRTASATHRIPSMPERKPLPSFSSAMKGAEKENNPPAGANLHTSVAGSKGLGGSVMSETELNGTLQVPQSTTTKKTSTLHAPTISSLARMQATVRSPQSSMGTSLLPAIQEPISILKSPTGNPLDSPLNIRPKRVAPATAPIPRSNSGLTFSSPLKPMTNMSPSKRFTSPSKNGAATPTSRRRPRISRGRVINKLNERRNAAAGSNTPGSVGKPRSSMALKAHARRSLGTKAAAGLAGTGPAMDVQRRARQTEIARRRSLRLKSPQKGAAVAI
ncbi:hypothetical protein CALVIDRAFT_532581 [Calocera viscosa TUFC12733]|uniref:Uncharacterized protein n=1 Tax=Calocera viscosa (strain TUFC12733) TaxID=1330018 RepID=A0A167SDV9_CALVF|nr:hypothetical protein CALVIDRAFT_532581 [Calocera viscosa TUFC12733]